MIKFDAPPNLDLKEPSVFLATWFGSGLINPAPGTWGSLAAIPFAFVIHGLCGLTGLIFFTLIFFRNWTVGGT